MINAGGDEPMVAKRLDASRFVTIIVSALLTGPGFLSHIVHAEEQRSSQEIQSLAEKGDPSAQLRLAEMYEQGDGVPKDNYQAWYWAQKVMAGAEFKPEAQKTEVYRQAKEIFLRTGEHVTPEQFLAGLKKDEQTFLAEARKDYPEVLKRYQAAAEAGEPAAQFQLGEMYNKGYDFEKAREWYRRAADQDHYGAQVKLSSCYYEGPPCAPKDDQQAYYWDLRAADGDERETRNPINPHAEYLAKLAVHIDPAKLQAMRQEVAQRVERKDAQRRTRAAQGDPRAQFELGYLYYRGLRVPEDQAQAYAWFRKAADQGFVEAFNYVGGAYYFGQGVPKAGAEAVRWYRKAAEHGDTHTQSFLGKIYSDGFVVPQDLYQAYFWLTLAASRGETNEWERGSDLRDVVAKQLTPEQIAQAEKEAAAWRQSK